MRILGIDPGTATLGWGVVEVKKGAVLSVGYGHIATEKEAASAARLAEIAGDLENLIRKYKPQEAAVEELFFFKNQKTVMGVSQARGVILLTLERLHVKIFGYTPLQVKQSLTNYGRAEKSQVQSMVKNILKLETVPQPDDVADALAIAICHAHRRKMEALKNE